MFVTLNTCHLPATSALKEILIYVFTSSYPHYFCEMHNTKSKLLNFLHNLINIKSHQQGYITLVFWIIKMNI